ELLTSVSWQVPEYLSEVGKLWIAKTQGRTEVSFTLNEDLANIHDIGGKAASLSAHKEHPFVLQHVGGQILAIFTEGSSYKLSLEGIVVQRAECQPAAEESSKPVRISQQLDKVVTASFEPVANHQYNTEYERKKKADGKQAPVNKQHVSEMLFSAFEKHQYYHFKDFVDITKQPELLKEIGFQNVKEIHKNTWELKPEYRHHQGEEMSD
uniref:General transcription factor IIF subunit 2 n=1 Tax=Aotus nancymaae TaxID=37293 RepID=A0A2K5CFH2_AOTNA